MATQVEQGRAALAALGAGAMGYAGSTQHELTIAVVGIGYANRDGTDRRFAIAMLDPGTPVMLQLEPRNRHDKNAIAVIAPCGTCIGYLPAERAPWVGGKIRDSLEVNAIYQETNGTAAFIRVRIGGGEPTLPGGGAGEGGGTATAPRREASASVFRTRRHQPRLDPDGFYPDPDGPEWGA